MIRHWTRAGSTNNFPDLFFRVVEDEQIVIETEPAIRQANIVHRVGGKLLDEILEAIPEIANGRTERKISGGLVPVKCQLFSENIEGIAFHARGARGRDNVRMAPLRTDNLRWLSRKNRITGRACRGIEPDRVRFRRELGESVARLGPRLFSEIGLLIHGWGSCLRP